MDLRNLTTLLGDQNFKIDSANRKLEDTTWIVNGQKVSIKVKVHPDEDIREYVSGVPAECVGQQVFTYAAALRETAKIGQWLPEDQKTFEQVIDSLSSWTPLEQYNNYLSKTKVKLAGCYSSGSHVFDDIGVRAFYRFADGTRVTLNTTTRSVARRDETMWYSVRLG